MPKAFAIHTIHIGRAPGTVNELTGKITKHALVDEYKPGDIFECSEKQFAELEKLGSVREANTVDEAAAEARGYVDPAVVRAANAEPEKPAKAHVEKHADAKHADKSHGDKGDGKPAGGDNLLG